MKTKAAILSLAALGCSYLHADYPIISNRYLADPAALVHDGRVYLYCSNDDENPIEGGYEMKSIVCASSSDMKNWTDHGTIFSAPKETTWAKRAWAPSPIMRDGRIFIYYGFGRDETIGVVTGDNPLGPFKDPIGAPLAGPDTPGVELVPGTWFFDPCPFIDDDGQAYLYCGGNGDNAIRILKLKRDMISLDGPAIKMSIKGFFEASWMHKRNGIYYFSYSAHPSLGTRIEYAMSKTSPTSGFTPGGVLGDMLPETYANNHHSVFEFKGKWYEAYHTRSVAQKAGISANFRRDLGLDVLEYNQDGSIKPVVFTKDGVEQVGHLNPYVRVEAETMNAQHGIETDVCDEGGMKVTDVQNGDWVKVSGVDFGSKGASTFAARVASKTDGGSIELRLGSPDGTLVGTCKIASTGGATKWGNVAADIEGANGVHDLYLKFAGGSGDSADIDWWQFYQAK